MFPFGLICLFIEIFNTFTFIVLFVFDMFGTYYFWWKRGKVFFFALFSVLFCCIDPFFIPLPYPQRFRSPDPQFLFPQKSYIGVVISKAKTFKIHNCHIGPIIQLCVESYSNDPFLLELCTPCLMLMLITSSFIC